MSIAKQAFRKYNTGDSADMVTIRLNSEQRDLLEQIKRVIREPKDSSAVKQIFIYGCTNVLTTPSTSYILKLLYRNFTNSQRSGNYAELPKDDDL